eukprot:s1332_g7.t1
MLKVHKVDQEIESESRRKLIKEAPCAVCNARRRFATVAGGPLHGDPCGATLFSWAGGKSDAGQHSGTLSCGSLQSESTSWDGRAVLLAFGCHIAALRLLSSLCIRLNYPLPSPPSQTLS